MLIEPLYHRGTRTKEWGGGEKSQQVHFKSDTRKKTFTVLLLNVVLLTLFRFSASNILALAASSFFFLLACSLKAGVKVMQLQNLQAKKNMQLILSQDYKHELIFKKS